MSANSLIELTSLNKDYVTPAGRQKVLKNISLSIDAGEFVALMGPSGSGKSTLMNILGCLDVPTSGNYFLEGRDVSLLDVDEQANLRNKMIGFIFQDFNLLPRANLESNVMLPLMYARVEKVQRKKRAQMLLEKVGLAGRENAMPNEISGGEKQRVAIARALANKPKIILADEPTGNLDSGTSKPIMETFKKLNQEEGITIFLVTHEDDIASCAKRQLKLLDGEIISDELTKRDCENV